jgi:hypothetical protein
MAGYSVGRVRSTVGSVVGLMSDFPAVRAVVRDESSSLIDLIEVRQHDPTTADILAPSEVHISVARELLHDLLHSFSAPQ